MRPGQILALLFAALGLAVLALSGTIDWAIATSEDRDDLMAAIILDGIGVLFVLLAVAALWLYLHTRLIRPLNAITREIETLSHAKTARGARLPRGAMTSELVTALDGLIERFVAARQAPDAQTVEAAERSEELRRRLEAILLDLSEGVIVCNLDHRILLYNQAAARLLKRPAALGLGRSLFRIVRADPILDDLNAMLEAAREVGGSACPVPVGVVCEPVDDGASLQGRLTAIMSAEGGPEGYVLTLTAQESGVTADELPPRPEFYDFDLFTQRFDRELAETPLKELRCVVFDTETTGLKPSEGDEMLSIGAVRVINGRVLTGETFDQLIDPGRKIPKASIRFHGITDDMVRGKPKAAEVLPQFRAFTGKAVLVAHNAAFDMKFLKLKQKASGVSFDNPVLDVLLLSAYLHDHESDHSLNTTAARFGVGTEDRHTALGDAFTTAHLFVAMLDPLAARGVKTLGEAIEVSGRMTKIRRQQANF